MAISNPTVWYVRDNMTLHTESGMGGNSIPGSIGWSAITAWAASTSISAGAIRRQTSGSFVGTGSRSSTTLTISAVTSGSIYLGMQLWTSGGSNLGTVTAFGTGTGGTGTYTVTGSGTLSSTTINGGFINGNQLAFIATVGGTTAATEPDWSKGNTKGTKVTDNTVTWVECTGQPGVNNDFTNTPGWVASQTAAVGQIIKDAAGTHLFICTTAGTTKSGAEPTWSTGAVGNTTTDNTATWTYIGTSFSAWAAPLATITQGTAWIAASSGPTFYVADDHAEQSNVSNFNINGTAQSAPGAILSVDHTSTTRPPASTDLKAGAKCTQNSASVSLQIGNSTSYYYGFTFDGNPGQAITNLNPTIGGTGKLQFDTCTFLQSSSGACHFFIGGQNNGFQEFYKCNFTFGATGNSLAIATGQARFRGGTIPSGGSTPSTLFYGNAGSGDGLFEGVDLSAITGTLIPSGLSGAALEHLQFVDCKLNASATLAATPVDRAGPTADFVRCSSDTKTYIQRRYRYEGTLQEEATIIRTGGASDGTTGISWNLTTNANSKWLWPLEAFPIVIWNPTTGGNVTVTLCGIWNAAAVPNNDDIWIDVEYLGNASTPLGSYCNSTISNLLASNSALTADSTSAWDSLATARANNHVYSVGDVIKSSNNAGRIFFCTTAGTSTSSEPGGYASAVDGGSVTDGTAVFRAGCRFTLTVTLGTTQSSAQPQLAGYLQAIVRAAKVSSTFYIDPLITLS